MSLDKIVTKHRPLEIRSSTVERPPVDAGRRRIANVLAAADIALDIADGKMTIRTGNDHFRILGDDVCGNIMRRITQELCGHPQIYQIEFDLSGAVYISSTFLRMLVVLYKRMNRDGTKGSIKIVVTKPLFAHIEEIKLDALFDIEIANGQSCLQPLTTDE